MPTVPIESKLAFFLLFGNVVWIAVLGAYMQRRSAVADRTSSRLWQVVVAALLVAHFAVDYRLVSWMGDGFHQLIGVQIALLLFASLVGIVARNFLVYVAFASLLVVTQVSIVFLTSPGTFLASHLGAVLLLIPLAVLLIFAEAYRALKANARPET